MMEQFRGHPVEAIDVEVAGEAYSLLAPGDTEAILEDPRTAARFAADEYVPYWATLWPAALTLADAVAAWPDVHDCAAPPRVLEVGCGLGLVGLVAARRGYRVWISDYDEDALAFVQETARRMGLRVPAIVAVDWRRTHADLHLERIVAADVLYERRNLEPVARFVAGHLVPGGSAMIADANRQTADPFEAIARDCGLAVRVEPRAARVGGRPPRAAGRIFHLSIP